MTLLEVFGIRDADNTGAATPTPIIRSWMGRGAGMDPATRLAAGLEIYLLLV